MVRAEYAVLPAEDSRLEAARAAYTAGRFSAMPGDGRLPPTGGDRDLWVRIEWENPGERVRSVALEILDFFEDSTDFHLEQADGTVVSQRTGENVRFEERSVWGRDPVLIFLTPTKGRFVTWLNNGKDDSDWPLYRVYDPADRFMRVRQWRTLATGAYYGALATLVAFGLFVLIVLRQAEVFHYLVYLVTFGLGFFLFQNLHLRFFPWLISPHSNLLTGALLALALLALVRFSRSFLAVERFSSRIDRILRGIGRFFGALAALEILYECAILIHPRLWAATLWFYHGHLAMYGVLSLGLFVVLMGSGLVLWRRGLRQARFYVLGLASIFAFMMPALASLQKGQTTAGDVHWIQAGSAMEVLLFGLAIADKVRLIRREKDEAVLRAEIEAAERRRLQQANEQIERQKALLEEQAGAIRSANLELSAQNRRLEELNVQKGEILGIAAHDLKNPLNALGGMAEVLKEDGARSGSSGLSAAERAQYLEDMVQSARRMESIIETLLRTEAVDSGRVELVPAVHSLAVLVDAAWRELARAAEAKRIRATIAIPAGVRIYVDWQRFGEVLDNLLSNAIKFSPPGGRVWIEAWEASSRGVVLTIRDSGPGFTEEDMPRVFGRYRKLSARPTGGESSTGLGLFIARRLIELQGGGIELASRAGESAAFRLTVPVGPPPAR